MHEQDVEKAWQVLSDSAENALQAGTGPGRSWVGPPIQQQLPPVKVEALQTVREKAASFSEAHSATPLSRAVG